MYRTFVLASVLAACGDGDPGKPTPDARVIPDVSTADVVAQPYRHTITLDGVSDFTSSETLATTSATFTAYLAWDDTNLFVGYSGPDLATTTSDAAQKWLFVYLDTTAGGEAQSEMYNTQRATLPTGFTADYYARYKVDGTLTSLQQNVSGTWTTTAPAPSVAQASTFVELAIPLSSIGAGTQVGIVTYMINEKDLAEGTYAGLYSDSFVDGYATNMMITRALVADFTAAKQPADY
jgi:hypothetical protein